MRIAPWAIWTYNNFLFSSLDPTQRSVPNHEPKHSLNQVTTLALTLYLSWNNDWSNRQILKRPNDLSFSYTPSHFPPFPFTSLSPFSPAPLFSLFIPSPPYPLLSLSIFPSFFHLLSFYQGVCRITSYYHFSLLNLASYLHCIPSISSNLYLLCFCITC